jgi:hypothetical protein
MIGERARGPEKESTAAIAGASERGTQEARYRRDSEGQDVGWGLVV